MNPIDILIAAGYKPKRRKPRWQLVLVMRSTGERAPLDYAKFTSTGDAMKQCVKLNTSLSPQAMEQVYFDWESIPHE